VVDDVAIAETHISTVFFSGDRAYKLLKPVLTDFLDYSDRPTRLDAAHRELELNRRLAPDVYLGLSDVHENGELVDHMLVMRRMPNDRRLSTLLSAVDGPAACLTAVARSIAGLHLAGPALGEHDVGTVTRDQVAANWRDNFDTIAPYVGSVIDTEAFEEARQLSSNYLDGCAELFARRIEQGWIRDGHGDLRAEDIFCLDDGPRILDCLAFSDTLRRGDVLADIGFLVMDLWRLVGPGPARELLADYQEFTAEIHPTSLTHHYVAYRAHVRVKVACLRYSQGDETQADEARELHGLALDHLRLGVPSIVVVGGGPGSGKSTVARALSGDLGLALVSSDETRKELAGLDPLEDASAGVGEGIYGATMTEAVYREMVRRAAVLLSNGEHVVLDATWSQARHREMVRALGARHRARLTEIECRVDRDLARSRVASRRSDPSDATPELVDHIAEGADPWPEATVLETDGPVGSVTDRAHKMASPQVSGKSAR
jgi:aminoglycoside phosphotransferase family enzyme/predicted kinase